MNASTIARPGWRSRRLRPGVFDAVIALAFVPIAVLDKVSGNRVSAGPLPLDVIMTSALIVLLALRRAAPAWVLVASCTILAVPTLFVRHDFFVFSHLGPLLIEMYTVARWCSARRALMLLVAPWTALAVCFARLLPWSWLFLFWFALFVGISVAGQTMRRSAGERAALANALERLDAERGEHEHLVVMQERARLALDLHDVVASAVSLMTVQAGTARRCVASDRRACRRAVVEVEAVGRGATADLRRMLGLLRVAGESEDLRGAPLPGVDAIDGLLPSLEAAGLRVRFVVSGDRIPLSQGLEVAIFRVVQEALTNTLKHAGPTEVQVRLHFGELIEISVVDDGPTASGPVARRSPSTPSGHGLLGMRERVELLGGSLMVGPSGNGFAVRVHLPVPVNA